jgi:hypothetical protein
MEDYLLRSAQAENNYIKYEEAQRTKQITSRKKKLSSGERNRAA